MKKFNVAAALSFALLAVQVLLPWTVPQLVTQDGPSHLYTATVTRNLALDALPGDDSRYSDVYHFNRRLTPNWGGVLLLNATSLAVGPRHAEQLAMSLALLLAYVSLSWALRWIAPEASPWTPVTNFLIHAWFLWMGLYSFYLSMVLCPLLLAYFVRVRERLAVRETVILSVSLLALYFVHIMGAAVGAIGLGVLGLWSYTFRQPRQLGLVLASTVPTAAFFLRYQATSVDPFVYVPEIRQAWESFPMHAFATGAGAAGGQSWLWPAILGLFGVAVLLMRKQDWRGVPGAWLVTTLLCFGIYLLFPDAGLSGGLVKIRFVWICFLLGGLFAAFSARLSGLRVLRTPIALYVTICMAGNFPASYAGLRATSNVSQEFLEVAKNIPSGATFVRLGYPVPKIQERFGYAFAGRDPLFHADALAAAECECIDLTDYQAASMIFPITFNWSFEHDVQMSYWAMERATEQASGALPWLLKAATVPFEYVLVVADRDSEQAQPDLANVTRWLEAEMRLVASNSFVKLYGPR